MGDAADDLYDASFDWDDDDECPDCHGEGVVAACPEPGACRHPYDGCDLCLRLCGCQHVTTPNTQQEGR